MEAAYGAGDIWNWGRTREVGLGVGKRRVGALIKRILNVNTTIFFLLAVQIGNLDLKERLG